MKRFQARAALLIAALSLPWAFPLSPAAAAAASAAGAASLRRFALAAGVNDGGPDRVRLRYAGSDAEHFTAVLHRFGGVDPADAKLLREPGRREFLAALADLKRRIEAANAAGTRTELLIYFSGHSDEQGMLFGPERIGYPEFRALIDGVPARIRLAVVDACASGALTREKGGTRLPAFAVDQSSNLSGYAFLTSSSGGEAAQESDRLRASFFTHSLLTGLRGAADRNQDGKVTLGEAYAFAFQETLARTERSQAGAQHPGYDMRLTGSGDLVLTDLRGTGAGLVLAPELQGRVFVRSSRGDLVAELRKQAGAKVELGLEPGLYDLKLEQGDSLFHALVSVDALTHAPVARSGLAPMVRERTRARGATGLAAAPGGTGAAESGDPKASHREETRPETSTNAAPARMPDSDWIAARAAIYPSLGFPGRGPGPWSHHISLNLFAGQAREIRGLQLSFGLNQTHGSMDGMQFGMFNTASGPSRGVQFGFLANGGGSRHTGLQAAALDNRAEEVSGAQIAALNHAKAIRGLQAGLVNSARDGTGLQAGFMNAAVELAGIQAGALNFARRQTGIQAGMLNAAGRQSGIQAGAANFADSARGLQVGAVNYARWSDGFVLGLLSIVGNGMHDVEATFDERSMLRTAFVLGGPYNYNYLSFDMKARHPRHLWGASAGAGFHIPMPHAFADVDAGAGLLYNDVDWENLSYVFRLRLIGGYAPMRWFNVFAGFTANLELWPASRYPNLNPDRDGEHWTQDLRAVRWPGFVLGVRI